jgi:hypothetical protein
MSAVAHIRLDVLALPLEIHFAAAVATRGHYCGSLRIRLYKLLALWTTHRQIRPPTEN